MRDTPEDTTTVNVTRRIVIVDIDHTIADAAWRDPLMGNWEEYYREQQYDRPIEFMLNLLKMVSFLGPEVIAVTARPERVRQSTIAWMYQHGFPIDTILMRSEGDYRPSPEVKCDLIREHFPDIGVIDFVLEDRDDCVAAYRRMGLNVLQVNHRGETHGKTAEAGARDYGGGRPEEPGRDPRGAEGDLRD